MPSQRVTQMSAVTTLNNTDVFYVVTQVTGTNGDNSKITYQDLNAQIGGGGGSGTLGGASVTATGAQSINNTTFTAVAFDSERYDTDSYHDNSTNNSRLTVPANGVYLVVATIGFAAAAGTSQLYIRVGGTNYVAGVAVPAPAVNPLMSVSAILSLSAANYVEAVLWQSSGSAKNTDVQTSWTPNFAIERLR